MSTNYRAYVHGVRELHQLAIAGKEDSPEADAIRDATDLPWEALSEVERERVGSLSEDLYSLAETPAAIPPMNPHVQAEQNEAFEAIHRGEWDRSLELLRRLASFLAPDLLSFLRGKIWLEAGDIETAVLFLEHASRLQPENGNYLAIFLYALEKVNPSEAQARARQIFQDQDKTSPVAVVRAADIMFHGSRSLPQSEATQQFRQLIPVLDHALSRFEATIEAGVDRWHYGIAVLLLGFCQELLGNTQAAVNALTRGLQVDPENPSLLGTRGILLYGASPQAVSDLELAMRNGAIEIWPFYFLAHHYLLTGRFDDCRRQCERLLDMNGSPAVRSEVSEWMAIAQAELGFPAEMVRASFEKAIRFDPSNERARHNLTAFAAANKPITIKIWETRSAGAVRTSGLAERRFAHGLVNAGNGVRSLFVVGGYGKQI
jgi:tetratricopeptide (TPR) repeat protein